MRGKFKCGKKLGVLHAEAREAAPAGRSLTPRTDARNLAHLAHPGSARSVQSTTKHASPMPL